ncbi:MAG: hypothetical protein LBI40_03635 [Treponema sp.]|jgi:hypothetical protein|nr:hypothetical protein [Treponema sp.]
MAKDRQQYLDKTIVFQNSVDIITDWEAKALAEMPQDESESALTKIKLAQEMTDLTSYHIVISEVSRAMLEIRNEVALNNGRRSIVKALSYMENVVSPYLDSPVSDYQDKLDLIESVSAEERYFLTRKIGLALDLLEDAFGNNSKWRWAFLDLKARCAVIAKNFFDMKNSISNMSIGSPNYEASVCHMRLIKKLMLSIADDYREKYELAGNVSTDLDRAILFLSALRRIHILFAESEEAENIKKKADVWQSRLGADMKAKEKADKK